MPKNKDSLPAAPVRHCEVGVLSPEAAKHPPQCRKANNIGDCFALAGSQ